MRVRIIDAVTGGVILEEETSVTAAMDQAARAAQQAPGRPLRVQFVADDVVIDEIAGVAFPPDHTER